MFRNNLLLYKSGRATPRFFCNPAAKDKCFVIKLNDAGKKVCYEGQMIKQLPNQQLKEQTKGATQNSGMRYYVMGIIRPILVKRQLQLKAVVDRSKPSQAMNLHWDKFNKKIVAVKENYECSKIAGFNATINELVVKSSERFTAVIRRLDFQRKLSDAKQTLKASSEDIKKLPEQFKEHWKVAKASDSFKTLEKVPSQTIELSKVALLRSRHHWRIFMKSEFKDQLVKATLEIVTLSWNKGKYTAGVIYKFIYSAYFEDPQPLRIRKKIK